MQPVHVTDVHPDDADGSGVNGKSKNPQSSQLSPLPSPQMQADDKIYSILVVSI